MKNVHYVPEAVLEVVANDVKPDEALAAELGFRYADLRTLLSQADIVTLHVPGNASTRHLLSSEEFGAMKHGAVLINTSRGDVVDVRALMDSLASGKVAGAGLDVLPEEPTVREEAELLRACFVEGCDLQTLLADHVLLRMRNVIITPHSAFNTREAVGEILETTRNSIAAFLKGQPENLITRKEA